MGKNDELWKELEELCKDKDFWLAFSLVFPMVILLIVQVFRLIFRLVEFLMN